MANDLKELDSLVSSLEKKFGKGIVTLMENSNNGVERWKLRSLNLTDLTCGGIPKSRIIEVYGPESNGKTTLATILGAEVQSQDGVVAYIDVENAIDPIYAKTLGLDISRCIFCQPTSGEEAIDVALALAESGKVALIIIDSVAALTPKAEIEGDTGDMQMGAQARLMGKACRKLVAVLGKTKTVCLFINQIRMKIGVLYGNPETTPGGLALKYYSSIRMEVRKSEWIEEGTGDSKRKIGFIANIKTVKNKVGIPFKKREMKIIFGKGLQVEDEFVDFALETGVILRRGTWYFYNDERLGQGKDAAIDYLKSNKVLHDIIEKETRERISKMDLNRIPFVIEDNSDEPIAFCNETPCTEDIEENLVPKEPYVPNPNDPLQAEAVALYKVDNPISETNVKERKKRKSREEVLPEIDTQGIIDPIELEAVR
jgi:recombination protein RecA